MSYVTIIAPDRSVAVGATEANRVSHSELDFTATGIPADVRALQWNGTAGHIEYVGDAPNTSIDALPAWATACTALWAAEESKPEVVTLANIKNRADALLEISDWSVLPDVALANKSDWVAYRQQLRAIRSSPTLDAVFPETPAKVWS